ncbi:PRC-barrel domain-containing protein [Amaricoccus solimangrovi]|uniref:PRC-barrel domain containing protein n=1 Tax=Amaricoccus solimangrovi TaxID=2589815 RepID=A0A501WZS6_9RHOB|nr:PRC-barrel domain-containing protein [Amaricoccus solimangrovi]TPE51666.1 PRC-barrel domain containing protein [Amaricoccus solimangrovi]
MRTFLASCAVAALLAGPTFAQQSTTPAAGGDAANGQGGTGVVVLFLPNAEPDSLYASDLIGMDVYSSENKDTGNYADRAVPNADLGNWNDIGEVNDIVLSRDGTARAVLVDVGGFLGMGEHTVALDMKQVHVLSDETNRQFIAVDSTRDELENAPEYERPDRDAMNATGATTTLAAGSGAATMADPSTAAMNRPAMEREGYTNANYDTLRADDLEDAAVYDTKDDNIGSIEGLLVSDDGKIDKAIVDVGGWLGIGSHRIALDYDEMQVMTKDGGDDVRVYVDQSREQLEQRPEYKDD